MRRAIALARGNPSEPFGCVIVDRESGQVIVQGLNRVHEGPLWHGETEAIRILSESKWHGDPANLVLYTTAEPCPMCSGAIAWAGIGEIVYGTSSPTLGRLGWRQFDLRTEEIYTRAGWVKCKITGGVCEEECDALFVQRD